MPKSLINKNAAPAVEAGMKVKFCGFTRKQDARVAVDLGVQALGFNFYPKSKRGLVMPDAFEWIGDLPRGPLFVAVMVNPSPDELACILESNLFDMVQFHGEESPDFCATCSLPWIKALPCPLPESFSHEVSTFSTGEWLLDAAAPAGQYGGTGSTADWESAAEFVRNHSGQVVWLAGGLSSSNVAQAIARVRPAGVDVAGGIESQPGIKCPEKMREFVETVRNGSTFER